MNANLKSLVMLLVFCAIAGGAYWLLVSSDILGLAQTRKEDVELETAQLEAEVLSKLGDVERIKLDNSLFMREDFVSMRDLTTKLPQPLLARPNPFADIP